MADSPWPVPTAEHSATLAKWPAGENAKAHKSQSTPLNAWVMYRLRFIFAADICGAWASFGGVAALLNSASTTRHLADTESIADALLYDGTLSARLGN